MSTTNPPTSAAAADRPTGSEPWLQVVGSRYFLDWLAEQNLALYSQADGTPRHQLLERFKQNPSGVLLGIRTSF